MRSDGPDKDYELAPPPAASMTESLRGVGYSLPAAIADIIDNSISARCQNVWLRFWWAGSESFISILDDGDGMTEEELSVAMRPGSSNPLKSRDPQDLGRFGLGLKTASFSHCRRLTVASRSAGHRTAVRRWDLDHIAETQEWQLLKGPAAGSEQRLAPLEEQPKGTLVLWEGMDRVVGNAAASDERAQDAFLAAAEEVGQHLSMVFHRYLESPSSGLKIFLNGSDRRHRLRPWDPFFQDHPATSKTPAEYLGSGDSQVTVRGFVLPHKDRLSAKEAESAAGPHGWVAHQGFYIYRNGRMLVAGDWLGLGHGRNWTKEETFRLARLQLDIPNTADSDWKIDIKKSRARPPQRYRQRLTDLADTVRQRARQVYVHRGSYGPRAPTVDLVRAWKAVETKQGVSYRIDRNHPHVQEALNADAGQREAIENMLRVIEETVPIQRIWLDTAEKDGVDEAGFTSADPEEILGIARNLYRHFVENMRMSPEGAKEQLLRTEPFHNYPDLISSLDNADSGAGANND